MEGTRIDFQLLSAFANRLTRVDDAFAPAFFDTFMELVRPGFTIDGVELETKLDDQGQVISIRSNMSDHESATLQVVVDDQRTDQSLRLDVNGRGSFQAEVFARAPRGSISMQVHQDYSGLSTRVKQAQTAFEGRIPAAQARVMWEG